MYHCEDRLARYTAEYSRPECFLVHDSVGCRLAEKAGTLGNANIVATLGIRNAPANAEGKMITPRFSFTDQVSCRDSDVPNPCARNLTSLSMVIQLPRAARLRHNATIINGSESRRRYAFEPLLIVLYAVPTAPVIQHTACRRR